MLIWLCPEGSQNVTTVGDSTAPTCASMQGQWVDFRPPFDPSSIDPAVAGAAFGAGFVLVAMGLLLSIPIRLIVRAIREF